MEKKLEVGAIVSNGIALGLKNFVPLLVNGILWILTIWIPYLNVGTTIGLVTIAAKVGRGESAISSTEIFNPQYRKYMGEFFLVFGFLIIGNLAGTALMVLPAIVIGIAWSLAPLLVLDKGMSPLDALKKSNDLTYGSKWTIFLGLLALEIVIVVVMMILAFIGMKIHQVVGAILMLGVLALVVPVLIGAQGYIYNQLTK